MFYSFIRMLAVPITRFLFKIEYTGAENLYDRDGFILCSNHRSLWDPIIIAIGVKKRKLCFMAKKELFRSRLLGAFISKLGAFPVDRGKGDKGAITRAERLIKNGRVLLIFPEGTRSKTGQTLRPKSGAAYIAADTGVDVIPVALCFEKKWLFRRSVTVRFGEPINNSDIALRADNRPADARHASEYIMEKIIMLLNTGKSGGTVCTCEKACDEEDRT